MAYSEDVNVNLNVLTGTISGITAIMGGMSALTSSFGAMGTEAANSFGTLDGLLVSSTALITTFGIKSAEAFGEYEQGMKIVQTVSNQAGYAINELGSKANQLSVSYRTAIGDITDGLQTLGRAGLNSAETQLEVLESGLQTAKLEGRNLNGVLEEIIQNTAMLGGDLKSIDFGNQAEYLNSLMVGTSMTAPINSHDISQTLQYAGGTAAAAGANLEDKEKLEDLMGTVAAFAQKGVKGSMAGTALRAFFTKPASQDKSVVEGLESIGLSPEDLWENGGESMKKVSDQVGLIKRQMDALNLSTMEQVEIWGKIVGPKMGQQMMKLDSSAIKDLTRDIEAAKSTEELSQRTLYTYNQKVSAMQQQGEMVFRGLGEKAIMFLTPVVDIVTKIFELLSNPWINTAAFSVIGGLLYHGLRKAWAMATTLFGEIGNLLKATSSEIARINGMASGSSAGFTQSASSVDLLNSKLAQTNAQLTAMQAQFLKLNVTGTGSPVMPLGIVGPGGRLPHNLISHSEQDVFRGTGILGRKGAYYDSSETKRLEESYRKQMAEQNAKNQAIRDKYSGVNSRGVMQYRSPETGRLMKEADFNKAYPIIAQEQIDKNVKSALTSGEGRIHSSLMSMTGKEYKAFMKDLTMATNRLMDPKNFQKGGHYVNADGSFNRELHAQDELKNFNRERQLEYMRNARQEGNAHINKVGGQTFIRAFKLDPMKERMFEVERTLQKQAQLKQFESARAENINRQRALAQGRGSGFMYGARQSISGMGQKGSDFFTKRINQYSAALGKAQASLLRWSNQLDTTGKGAQMKLNSAIDTIAMEMEEAPMTFEQALARLGEITNFTAAELEGLLTSSEQVVLSEEEMSLGMKTLNDKLIALGLTTVEGEVAEATHTSAVLADIAATEGSALSKAKDSLMGGMKSLAGFMGGPLMIGMMGFMFAMQAIQASQRAWQEKMQEATNQLSEATDKMSKASDKIKDLYSSENEGITEANLAKAVDEQYATINEAFYGGNGIGHYESNRDDLGRASFQQDVDLSGQINKETGKYEMLTAEEMTERQEAVEDITLAKDENVKALNENTMALLEAVSAYNQAQNKEAKLFNDPSWGANSVTAGFTDQLGERQEEIWNVGSWLTGQNWLTGDFNGIDRREGFFDSNSPVLTGSQADSNYAGSTDFAAIFAMDTQRFGVEQGLRQFFGSDYDRIISLMGSMDNKIGAYGTMSGQSALMTHANNMANMDPAQMAQAQMFMKNNPETMQMLGKQMFRYEQQRGLKSGHTAYEDWSTGTLRQRVPGTRKGDKNAYKEISKAKFTVQDKNLDRTIKKIMAMTDNKLSYANVLAMGQLQQLQDMYQVATESVAPGIMQTVQGVYDNVSATGGAAANAGSAAGGAVGAAANAAAIAAMLGAMAQDKAEEAAYNEWKRDDKADQTINGVTITDKDSFVKAISKGGTEGEKWQSKVFQSLSGTGWSLSHPGASPEMIKQNAERLAGEKSALMSSDASYQDKLNTATSAIINYAQGAVIAAYDQSNIGEYGGGNRDTGSGGSGGGDGSGKDSNKDSGTKKERVDLVLCNKKEIPKLNVNLFKKPPNFTVLNKNFKLRDIKINSEDKPKAIMNAIKNGIIETQKRMDPKIIQDEAAEYNPVEATDGGSTPSGTTQTTT